jgi:hypothetical protein
VTAAASGMPESNAVTCVCVCVCACVFACVCVFIFLRLQQEIVGPWSIWPLVQFYFKQSFELLESCSIGVHYLNLRGKGENIDMRTQG